MNNRIQLASTIKASKRLWAKLCIIPALAALAGCGGATPDCGADETLDLVRDTLLKNTFMPEHKRKLERDLPDKAAKKIQAGLGDEYQAAKAAALQRGMDEYYAHDAALSAAGINRETYLGKLHAEVQAEQAKIAGSAVSPDELLDLYNVQIAFVSMTRHNQAVDAYQCSAQVTSNFLRDLKINYTVKRDAADSSQFFVEVFAS